jgi:hypothetical protein
VTAFTGIPGWQRKDEGMSSAATSLVDDPIVVPHETTLELYRKMLTVFFVEERMKVFVKRGNARSRHPPAVTKGTDRHDHATPAWIRLVLFPITGRKPWPSVSEYRSKTSSWGCSAVKETRTRTGGTWPSISPRARGTWSRGLRLRLPSTSTRSAWHGHSNPADAPAPLAGPLPDALAFAAVASGGSDDQCHR